MSKKLIETVGAVRQRLNRGVWLHKEIWLWREKNGYEGEGTRHELKIVKWYDNGSANRSGEIMFLSARGQAMEHVLNIQTETSEESEKAPYEVEEGEQFRNSWMW